MAKSNMPPPSQLTKPDFFIIESLNFEDEQNERFEGKFLQKYLKILGKEPLYYYIRTKKELEFVAQTFRNSGYRYLYVSCHGAAGKILTTLDEVTFEDFASIFSKKLEHRRLFVSGCSLGQHAFAEALFTQNGGLYTVTAPKNDVLFAQMLPFWSSFFYRMGIIDVDSMKGPGIWHALRLCANMFNVNMVHFYKKSKNIVTAKEFIAEDVLSDEELEKILKLKTITTGC